MAGKAKIVRGALEALTDVFKKGSDEPADPSRRALLKAAPAAAVGGAGALAGIGGAAMLGAKALFGQGRFDKIISEIKPAIDEFYESGDWEGLGKTLDLTPNEIDNVLKHDTFAGEYLDDAIEAGEGVIGSTAERDFLRDQWDSLFDDIEQFPTSMFYRDLGAPLFKHMAKKLESDLLDDKELIELSEILF
jgi:hypothetical protein